MISDHAASLGSLQDYSFLIGGLNSGLGMPILSISTARLMVNVFLESTVPAIWIIGISSHLPRHIVY